MINRIVFIDSHIADHQSLIEQIPAGSEVILLNAERDGLLQIVAALQSRFELDTIDIISHGTPGALMLGSGELNSANLTSYAEQLTEIGTHLGDSGDILLYGCEVAKGNVGQRFIEQLAQLIGANVAASTNLTGAEELGGDWILGAQIGTIESRAMQLSYDGVLIGEFRVNTTTTGDQVNSSITTLKDGGFVVSWQSNGQDGSGFGIYAQRYDANGVAVSDEFWVNTHTNNEQANPTITALADGGFVVSWSSWGQDFSGDGIYAQRYGADGAKQGGEFLVNTGTSNDQLLPTITALKGEDGGFVVSWVSYGQNGNGWSIYAQRYDADGVSQGSEFKVNTYNSIQFHPSITALANGGFVVSWQSHAQDSDLNGIYAQRFDDNGVKQGGEFQVNSYTTNHQNNPSITALKDGGFVVSWSSWGQDLSGDGIYAQRYGADGAKQGGEFLVNTGTSNDQLFPTITALKGEDGGFVVSWQSYDQDGSDYGIYAQRYDADGEPVGDEFRVNTHTDNEQANPTITALADGGFVVSWQSYDQDGNGSGIYAQRYDANGTPIDRITAPTDINLSNNHVNENSATETEIGTLTSVDANSTTGFTYALVDGAGSTDNASFIINGDKILLNTAVNYEVKNSYSIRIKTTDAGGLSYEESFTISVDNMNEKPTGPATGMLVNGTEDVVYSVSAATLLQEFTDEDADNSLSVTNLTSVNGTFAVTENGWNFTPTQDYNGPVIFTYQVSDGADGIVDVTRTLNLLPVNDKPVGSPAGVLANDREDTPYTILQSDLLNGYSDVDGDVLAVAGLTANHGTLSAFNSDTNSWTCTPSKDFNGTVNLAYGITDGKEGNVSGINRSFIVDPVNDIPEAGDDQGTVLEDSSVTVGFDAFMDNDFDADGSDKTIIGIDATGTKCSVSIDTNNRTITYSADADVFDLLTTGNTAMDSFKYILQGSTGEITTATVQISVQGVSDGNLNMLGTVHPDTLNGTAGEDRIKGNNGNDILNGGEGADDLFGENGDDILNGGNSIDNLFGGNGNDILDGGNGDDWLGGEKGDDTLTGGMGNDVFLFAKSGGNDIITDFANGFDKIQIAADTGKTNFGQLTIIGGTDANGTAYTTINLGSGGQATLIGVSVADVDAADFIFPV